MGNQWRKLVRDVRGDGGRAVAILVALTIGIFTVSTMLGAYGIVRREIGVNYLATNPASATIEVNAVTPEVLATARSFPGIAIAEGRGVVEARARVGDDWMRMLLFVVDDFDAMRLNTFTRISGAWPPPADSLLVEREAVDFLQQGEGGALTVRTPHGTSRSLAISGIVHDTTLAPAWQEQTGYGYITPDTLAAVGEAPLLDELRIQLDGNPMDTAVIDSKAIELAEALGAEGVNVRSIKVPPPGQHPHQGQMLISLAMFAAFSAQALILSAILVAAVLAAMLARQTREIGIMKAVGARTGQIAVLFGAYLLALGILATAVGVPLGIMAAGRLSQVMADTMNFTVTSSAVPTWISAVLTASGLLLPLAVSSPALAKASRTTVREALGAVGIVASFGARRFDRALAALGGTALPYLLALRNVFRRRGRLVLALALLAAGGALFMTALNVRDGWRAMAGHVFADRLYDADLLLNEAAPVDRIARAMSAVDGVRNFEVWSYSQTAVAQAGRMDVMRTYPDRGHGGFTLFGVPPATAMIALPVLEGRWLADDDVDAVVLTAQTRAQKLPSAKIGDQVLLSVNGKPAAWRLVGIVLEVGGGGAYVTSTGYARAAGMEGEGNEIRLTASGITPEDRNRVVRAAENALDDAGLAVQRNMPLDRLYEAMVGHVEVPIAMLVSASVLLALIGGIGLASMVTVNVLERTREIGVMKAIGARPAIIVRIIASEAVIIAGASFALAVLLSLPLTLAIGRLASGMFGAPLPLTVSWGAAAGWLALVVVIALLASAAPAFRGARLVVREALAYE